MNLVLRVFIMCISILVFYSVIYRLVKRQLSEANSILWIFIGFLTLIAGFFPKLIDRLAYLVGVDYPPTLLFLLSTIFLMLITFRNSIQISKTESKMNELAITLSILKEENNRLNEAKKKYLPFDNKTMEGKESL